MERSERSRLEAIKRDLQKNLKTVDALLCTAHAPHRLQRLSRRASKERARAICKEVKKRGGRLSREELRDVLAKAKMPFTAVGGLFGAGYLKNTTSGTALGVRGRGVTHVHEPRRARMQVNQ